MIIKLKETLFENISKDNKGGDCYQVAYRNTTSKGWTLVHAIVTGQGAIEGIKYGHAFNIDESTDEVIDNSNGRDIRMQRGLYFYFGKIEYYKEYTKDEAMELALETGHYGPWDKIIWNAQH